MRLLRFARALKDGVVILSKCPWGAMTINCSYAHRKYNLKYHVSLANISARTYYAL